MAKAEIAVGLDKFRLHGYCSQETPNLCFNLRVDGVEIYNFSDLPDCERLTFSDWAIHVAKWMVAHKVFEFDIVNGRRYLSSDEVKECGTFPEVFVKLLRDYIEHEMSIRIKSVEEMRMLASGSVSALREVKVGD